MLHIMHCINFIFVWLLNIKAKLVLSPPHHFILHKMQMQLTATAFISRWLGTFCFLNVVVVLFMLLECAVNLIFFRNMIILYYL